MTEIYIEKCRKDAKLPSYAHDGDARDGGLGPVHVEFGQRQAAAILVATVVTARSNAHQQDEHQQGDMGLAAHWASMAFVSFSTMVVDNSTS